MHVEHIDDATDARLGDYRQLTDAAARRRIEGDRLFVAEGPTAIARLLASGHTVRSVLVTAQKLERMRSMLEATDASIYEVDVETLRQIAGFNLHRGAIAAADRLPARSLADVLATARRIAVLEGLNDPENLGAIARSARAFGIDGLVLDPTCIDPYTRRPVRVSMGEILFLPWCRVEQSDWPAGAFEQVHALGFETWAMSPSGEDDIWSLDVPDRLAIVLGAEGPGLSPGTIAAAGRRVRLPIAPDVDSLNVGAAAAVSFAVTRHANPG
jgi:tRNA G18 (ribose-2'-O)-methylase SpoU